MFTASSSSEGNEPYGWMLVKGEHGEWKFTAARGVNRRNLKVGEPSSGSHRPPSRAPSPGMRAQLDLAPPY
ncbi:hypothetical protein vseg_013928 [Gypsophila vaccaria]